MPVSKQQFIISANGSATVSILVLAIQETISSCPELLLTTTNSYTAMRLFAFSLFTVRCYNIVLTL